MENYNEKNYYPSTYTIPKTEGQLFAQDIVLNSSPSSYDSIPINKLYINGNRIN